MPTDFVCMEDAMQTYWFRRSALGLHETVTVASKAASVLPRVFQSQSVLSAVLLHLRLQKLPPNIPSYYSV